jgi:hypothetical protein
VLDFSTADLCGAYTVHLDADHPDSAST